MRPPLEIAGVSLTPRWLFWAYKAAVDKLAVATRRRGNYDIGKGLYYYYSRKRSYHLALMGKISNRLDRILKEQEE